jgi:SAM-dependent methyltransferase
LRILLLLAAVVGLPYFLLSTTGPLLQAWYARSHKGATPYRLYALSNAGSMFALLSYPILFEPKLTSHEQALIWSVAYAVFVALCGWVALRAGKAFEAYSEPSRDPAGVKPSFRMYVMWLLLPACASALLLAVSNHLAQNVAAIPFLWVLPLSVYLLSFIFCFEGEGWYRRNPYLQLLAVALASMAYAMFFDNSGNLPIKVGGPLFLLGLFTCCMVCHGELAKLKPHPQYLTHFYLMMSAGGALGGLFVGVIAPQFFNSYYEMPISLVACGVLAVLALREFPDPEWFENLLPATRYLSLVAFVGLGSYAIYGVHTTVLEPVYFVWNLFKKGDLVPDEVDRYALAAGLVVVSALALAIMRGDARLRWARRWSHWAAFVTELTVLALAGYIGYQTHEASSGYRLVERNFYGGLKVRDSGAGGSYNEAVRTLTHGTINHGEQFLAPSRRRQPTTYYGPKTGVGLAILEKQNSGPIRVGVIGLGTGTLAAYGRQGDYYRFYELNPLVQRIATTEFHYLPDCPAKHDVAIGDARLSLEREAPENFDVLAVDAFSSDSIPVHLLTREAMQLYFRHLKPNGILAVHISNRYLDLEPVVQGEAEHLGKVARLVDTDDDSETGVFAASWVLVTAPTPGLPQFLIDQSAKIETTRKVRLWTDDYSNLFQILK